MADSPKPYVNELEQEEKQNSDRTVTFADGAAKEGGGGDENGRSTSPRSGTEELEAANLPQYQYSKEELMKIGKHPVAKKWPEFLDQSFTKSTGTWDPEKWFKSKRRSESPQVDDLRSKRERPPEFERDVGAFKRRTPDPKERIKEERDEIILSPQRRSFGTGCHVTQIFSSHRPGSPLDSREADSIHREPSRRIGSGRIVTRDRDQRGGDWDKDHREFGYGAGRNRDRFERESEKENNRYSSGGRYRSNDRRLGRGRSDDRIEEEEEPEWFSSGPTSQSETIELVGFEDEKKKGVDRSICRKTKDYFSRNKILEETTKEAAESDNSVGTSAIPDPKIPEAPKPLPPHHHQPLQPHHHLVPDASEPKSQDFDVNDIFKMDWFLPNGTPPDSGSGSQGGLGGSRFSQWFSRGESPTSKMMPSFHDDLTGHVLRSGLSSDQQQRGHSPPLQMDHHFFLDHTTGRGGLVEEEVGKKNIMEILQNANINVVPPLLNYESRLKEHAMSGKVKCVEELEANLKQLVLGKPVDGERSAFNKLVSHLTDSSHSPSPPASLSMGPMDKSKVLQEEDLIQNMYMEAPQRCTPPLPPPPSMPDVRISPTPASVSAGPIRTGPTLMDLLKSTEKQAMMAPQENRGLMKKPPQQQQQNNTLADLMRTWSGQSRAVHNPPPVRGNISPCLSVVVGPPPELQQQQQMPRQNPVVTSSANLTVFGQQPPVLSHAPSPIHPSHGNTLQVQGSPVLPRVPSPQELAAHTQTILHNALIKRKLEEQKENFRKRQEAQRSRSPNPPVPVVVKNHPTSPAKVVNTSNSSSSTLAAFTPTSVMRKMHSEKYDGLRPDIHALANKLQGSPDPKNPSMDLHHQQMMQQTNGGGMNLLGLSTNQQDATSPTRPVPRALHGQGALQRQPPQMVVNPSPAMQGRPIVKGNPGPAIDQNRGVGGKVPVPHNKQQYVPPNQQGSLLRPDMDQVVRLVEQQHRILAAQRTLNASPMPPPPAINPGSFTLGGAPRAPPTAIHHPNLLRPALAANNNINLLRSMVQANFNNPALRAQNTPLNHLTQLTQLAALQQQQQQQQQQHQQQQQQQQNRGALDPRQLRNLHPLTLQQLFLNVQSQSPAMMPLNNNVGGMPGTNRMDGSFHGAQGMKTLMPPGQPNASRQSPVNLARWFGNDVLKQKMPDMPPVPHQKALLVEEVERQQQQSTTVHN